MERPHIGWLMGLWATPILVAGCTANNQRVEDPLLGGAGTPPRQVGANTRPTPSPQWGNSTAALTANPRPSLNPDTRLAIENRGDGTYLPSIQQTGLLNDGLTITQARERLKVRGVNWEKVEAMNNGQFVYRCSVPNPQNPALSRFYEAQAADELSARRAVLEQMEKGL